MLRASEDSVVASCLSAFDPAPTSTLMKIPGSSATASPAKPVAAGGRKARPSIKALQEEKPPPFTPVPGVPLASSNTATTTAATRTADADQELEEDVVRVPGIIPPNVLPLQSESPSATVPRYSTAIAQLLEARGTRTTARLGFKGLGDAGATELASILSTGTCQKLEGLDVSCNEMGAIGASALAVALRKNHVLQTLDLSTNGIGDQGVTALADALQFNTSLTYIDLHACGVRDKGATALAAALENNCTLAVLNLKANYLTDEGAVVLARVARKSKSLRALITSSNDIEHAGAKALEDAIYENDNLVDYMPVEVLCQMR